MQDLLGRFTRIPQCSAAGFCAIMRLTVCVSEPVILTEAHAGWIRPAGTDGMWSDHSCLQPASGSRRSRAWASGASGGPCGAGHTGARIRLRARATGFFTLSGEDHLPHPTEAGYTPSSRCRGPTHRVHVPQTEEHICSGTPRDTFRRSVGIHNIQICLTGLLIFPTDSNFSLCVWM